MADKQVKVRFTGVDGVTPVIQGILEAAGGFLLRDVVLASWGKLRESVVGLASDLVDVNSQWETFNTQFFVQLGRSATATKQRMAELEKFAVKTPFQLEEIIEADRALQVFGLHASNAAQRFGMAGDKIRTVAGDVAAGTGMAFTEISQWLGRFSVGDTGMAIRRFEQMGVTTKQELRSMGLEFSKAGELTAPLDKSMTALLQVMERKFGGLMDIQSRTTEGMKSNLADFVTVQKRLWGEPVFDLYKSGLSGLMSFLNTDGVQGMLRLGQNMFTAGTEWLGNLFREWGGWFGTLAANALNWGANIVDSFASGIAGSGAVSGALRNLATDISSWLKPGSPPKLLPYLDDWGEGAAEAWLQGWAGATPRIQPILARMGRELAPFLEKIDLGGKVGAGDLREGLGPQGLGYEAFVASYQRVHDAVASVAKAKAELADAETGGDEKVIEGARVKLTLAEREETAARKAMTAEQRKISERVTAEDKLLEAVKAQLAAVQNKEKAESDSAAKAAERATEAEQRAREQAYLQYRLTVAGTAEGQAAIWEEELKKAEEGSAEWWNIKTRLVELQRKAANEQGEDVGAAYAGGFTAALEANISDKKRIVPIAWSEIGKAIGGALTDGIVSAANELPTRMLGWATKLNQWATSEPTRLQFGLIGLEAGRSFGTGILAFFGLDATSDNMSTSITGLLAAAVGKSAMAVFDLGYSVADGFVKGMSERLGGPTAEDIDAYRAGQAALPAEEQDILSRRRAGANNWPAIIEWLRSLFGGFASGTSFAPGGWSLVGERGPELVNLPMGSQVTPADKTAKAMRSTTVNVGAGAIVINVANGNARDIQRGVVGALRQIGMPA